MHKSPSAYWLKMSESVRAKLNTVKPLARSANGRISTVYDTMSGVNAICSESERAFDMPCYRHVRHLGMKSALISQIKHHEKRHSQNA